jgi:hypothetical protein
MGTRMGTETNRNRKHRETRKEYRTKTKVIFENEKEMHFPGI